MITKNEMDIARKCIKIALEKGADSVRVSLNKSVSDSVTILNGETDKVSHAADRSLYFYIFTQGRYGTFSTNRVEDENIGDFIGNAVQMVRMLGEDACRRLPDISISYIYRVHFLHTRPQGVSDDALQTALLPTDLLAGFPIRLSVLRKSRCRHEPGQQKKHYKLFHSLSIVSCPIVKISKIIQNNCVSSKNIRM